MSRFSHPSFWVGVPKFMILHIVPPNQTLFRVWEKLAMEMIAILPSKLPEIRVYWFIHTI